MLACVRATRAEVVAGEVRLMVLAAEWADAHPDLDEEPHPSRPASDPPDGDPLGMVEAAEEFDEERGVPGWAWSATAPFAAALGRSTVSGHL